MNSLQELAEMTRDYGLVRYFALTLSVVAVLMVILFIWGHRPEESNDIVGPPAATQTPSPPAAAPPVSY
jgi:hypothetical protein